MSFLHVFFNICCLAVSINSMTWFSSDGLIDIKPGLLGDGGKMWLNWREKISGNNISKIHHVYYQYIGTERARNWKSWCRKLLFTWVVFWSLVCLCIFTYMNAQALEKRKESLANMCDERARMLQDLFNVSMNHVQALSILISTFHHERDPSAIDQETFATYTERTSFERPLMSGVAYAVRVLHSEREQFEKQQGWTIKKMNTFEQTPVHKHDYAAEKLKPSPNHKEYAPVIFAQDTVSHVISVDMLSGKEDRENILRARASGKGVLTSPFRLIKTNRLGVILTFAVYKIGLSSSASSDEMIQASLGYLGGIFDIESLVERLLDQLASKQTICVNVYDTTNILHPISMYSSSVSEDALEHASSLNFGDPFRKHEMHCSFKERPPWPLEAIVTSMGTLVIVLLVGYIFHATVNRIAKVEDDYEEMMELKKRAEAADIAKSQFLATVSHEIRTPMNGVLGMLQMLMDTDLDVTQQDYVRTAQTSGRALVSLINEVLDQARIEYGKLELEVVPFDLRAIMDDVLSLFSGKSQEKGVELAAYVSDRVPKILIGDPGRFRQIITNLVGNSIKFTEEGHIFVTVHLVEEVMNCLQVEAESLAHKTLSRYRVADRRHSWRKFKNISQNEPYCQFSLSSNPINIIVSVEDTGVGIPEEAQQRVFTPFMQVGPSMTGVGGTGIGLSISKYLVGFMNGEIGFVSIPKIGSTFSFTAVFSNGCSSLDYNDGQKISNQADPISSEFIGMTALVVDNRSVRAKVSRYHIQRLGISVEITSDLNQEFSARSCGNGKTNTTVDMVFVEQEVWDDNLGFSDLFVYKFMKNLGHGIPPKLFILSNSIASTGSSKAITSGEYIPTFIRKPLRAGMLAASIKQAMGVENKGHSCPGQVLSLPLRFLQGRKILVVDDNRVNLRVAFGALKKYGADVVCAATGKEAIALLEPPHSFDACFMDIQMPEMDGFVATGMIRDLERNINSRIQSGDVTAEAYENVTNWHLPILAMTADVIQATHEKCLRCGMDGYVTKPFEAEQLCREVSRFFQPA